MNPVFLPLTRLGFPVAELGLILLIGGVPQMASAQFAAHDPGVRGGAPGAGGPLPGLTADETTFFNAGSTNFQVPETIAGANAGLGPRFNLDQCSGCHAQPAVGGTSPSVNPQPTVGVAFGAKNTIPSFIQPSGPVREARFKLNPDGSPDGSVHSLFVISGRVDSTGSAAGCTAVQENFNAQYTAGNISLRIPTPVFGGGLIEAIEDSAIVANLAANQTAKSRMGIGGHPNRTASFNIDGSPNRSANDGTITRFGWKAQNKSLLMFAGEAYNVEMGISNELFPTERDENSTCQFSVVPNDSTTVDHFEGLTVPNGISDIERFAFFMKFLAPPTPSTTVPGGATSIANGQQNFTNVGCSLCHTPSLQTSNISQFAATTNITANLFSDLVLHHMGPNLADGIAQGSAAGDEFRTAPLWGLGQRIFFLHDGRTTDLVQAIKAHSSVGNSQYGPSEANQVIAAFNALPVSAQQDLLNFLRSL
jgi:CxxC motif-containing protein (DUF1111 family)